VRGIDCSTRRRFRGRQREKMFIGHKQDHKTRYQLPSGYRKLLITSENDIEMLLMNNRTYCGEIAQNISVNKRLRIVQRAKELNVRLTNANAKAKKVSTE
jgi:large subunit ribosomal protein L32e